MRNLSGVDPVHGLLRTDVISGSAGSLDSRLEQLVDIHPQHLGDLPAPLHRGVASSRQYGEEVALANVSQVGDVGQDDPLPSSQPSDIEGQASEWFCHSEFPPLCEAVNLPHPELSLPCVLGAVCSHFVRSHAELPPRGESPQGAESVTKFCLAAVRPHECGLTAYHKWAYRWPPYQEGPEMISERSSSRTAAPRRSLLLALPDRPFGQIQVPKRLRQRRGSSRLATQRHVSCGSLDWTCVVRRMRCSRPDVSAS
jgi:hypothetical protein